MPTDHELMKQVSSGDPAAFNELFDRFAGQVRRRLLGIVRNEAAAEDLVQEVFLRLWIKAEQWKGSGSLRSWLLRMATNLALNYLRSTKRQRVDPPSEQDRLGKDHDDLGIERMIDEAVLAPDAEVEQTERWRAMQRLVDMLPEQQRDVIRMVHEMEMTIQETAEVLEIPSGTVKSRLFYARTVLTREWDRLREHYE